MRILREQGIVDFYPRRGNHIVKINAEELLEIFEIRRDLEIEIIKKLINKNMLDKNDFNYLTDLTTEMATSHKKCKTDEEYIHLLNTLDLSFHKYLWKASKSVRREQILEGLFYQLLIAMNQDTTTLGSFNEKAKEHLSILKALESGNVDTAVKEFRSHIEKYIKSTLSKEEIVVLDYFS